MIDKTEFTNALCDTLRRIAPLVALLTDQSPDSIIPYIDLQPKKNTIAAAIYGQAPGTVVVAWTETVRGEAPVWWVHRATFFLRAQNGQSPYDMEREIMRGVPVPGDGQRWYRCPIMDGVNPTDVMRDARETDPEQIDLMVIETETTETGDA